MKNQTNRRTRLTAWLLTLAMVFSLLPAFGAFTLTAVAEDTDSSPTTNIVQNRGDNEGDFNDSNAGGSVGSDSSSEQESSESGNIGTGGSAPDEGSDENGSFEGVPDEDDTTDTPEEDGSGPATYVWIGDTKLTDGDYLGNDGQIFADAPSIKGYAHLKDGVLTLKDFIYEGEGYVYDEFEDSGVEGEGDSVVTFTIYYVYTTAIYAEGSLELVLVGNSTVKNTLPDADFDAEELQVDDVYTYNDGVSVQGDLTVTGTGALTIEVFDDGIDVGHGDMIIKGGTIMIEADDDGIDISGGNLIVTAGDLTVNAHDHGIEVDASEARPDSGQVTISGGKVSLTTDTDEGIYVDGNVTISGGEVYIDADDDGIDINGYTVYDPETGEPIEEYYSSLTISGGTVNVVSDEIGITVYGDVTISGGTVNIVSDDTGISAYGNVTISGGTVIIESIGESISAEGDVTIDEENATVTIRSSVYVGGVNLADGEYLGNDGKVYTEAPADMGYAYFKNGVLTLNNFVYEGKGYVYDTYKNTEWIEEDVLVEVYYAYSAAIYANSFLELALVGKNSLKNTLTESDFDTAELQVDEVSAYGFGVYVYGHLTVTGTGTLTIETGYDGIYADGDVTVSSGSVTIDAGDDGIDAIGSVTVSGGTLEIEAGYWGIYVDAQYYDDEMEEWVYGQAVTISSGSVSIVSGYESIFAYGGVTVSGGNVTIEAGSYGIYAYSDVTVSGGNVTIEAAEDSIYASGGVTIDKENATVTIVVSVYVGGVKLTNGQYLGNDGKVYTEAPAGMGYAYLKGNVLTLNNFVYEGPGYVYDTYKNTEWNEEDVLVEVYHADSAAIYADSFLELALVGKNSLKNTLTESDFDTAELQVDEVSAYGFGVYVYGHLTVTGAGTLTIETGYEGIYADGDVTVSSGSVTIDAGDDGIDAIGSVTVSGGTLTIDAEDDGIIANDSMTVSGGTLEIEAGYWGIYVDTQYYDDEMEEWAYGQAVTISSGSVSIVSGHQSIYAYGDVTVIGGNVAIEAAASGIYIEGNVTISGGDLEIYAADNCGIQTSRGNVTISGGTVTIESDNYYGVYSLVGVEISGGHVEIRAGVSYHGIGTLGTVTVSGGILDIYMSSAAAIWGDNGVDLIAMTVLAEAPNEDGRYILVATDLIEAHKEHSMADQYSLSHTHHWKTCPVADCYVNLYPELCVEASGYGEHTGAECVCGYDNTAEYDVYVGGVGLKNGQYLGNDLKLYTEAPTDMGYAYYKDGKLTLNNFVYEGEGYWYTEAYSSCVYTESDLEIVLVDENSLTNTANGSAGVTFTDDLSITGPGSLAIDAYYGIYTEEGNITISGSDVTIKAGGCGIYTCGNATIENSDVTIAVDECGIYAEGDVEIKGSVIEIVTGAYGIYTSGDVTVEASTVTIEADYYGINAEGDVEINGSVIEIVTGAYGIYTSGDVTVEASTVTIEADYYGIITTEGGVTLENSTVTVTGGLVGIVANTANIYISDSTVKIGTGYIGIYILNGDLTVSGESTVEIEIFQTEGIGLLEPTGISATGNVTVSGGKVVIIAPKEGTVVGELILDRYTTEWRDNIFYILPTVSAELESDELIYDGTAQTPAVTVTYKGKTLTEGVDYEILGYENNINAGVATVTVKGIGEYAGIATATFTISPRVVELVWSNTTLEYNKEKQAPTAVVGNLVAGDECTVTVKGDGKYSGTFTAEAVALDNPNYVLPANTTTEYTIWADSYKVVGDLIPNSVKIAVSEAVSEAVSDIASELSSALESALENAFNSFMDQLKGRLSKVLE